MGRKKSVSLTPLPVVKNLGPGHGVNPGVKILCSPAEPEPYRIRSGAIISNRCENLGLDFMWVGNGELWGVQRKRFPDDFLSSLADGRLGKEMLQIEDARANLGLDHVILALEGRAHWSGEGGDGVLINAGMSRQEMSKRGLERLLWRMRVRNGVVVEWVDWGAIEFGRWIRDLAEWSNKEERIGEGLDGTRGRESFKNNLNLSDKIRKKRWRSWVLQGIPKIGPATAEKLLRAEKAPLIWAENVEKDLEKLVGEKLGKELRELMQG